MGNDDIFHEGIWGSDELRDENAAEVLWGQMSPGVFRVYPRTSEFLPAGMYMISKSNNDGASLYIKADIKTDECIAVKDSQLESIIKEVDEFWKIAAKFEKAGFLHRRGYLFYGPQGTGKTTIVNSVVLDTIKKGGVVFLCQNPAFMLDAIKTFRKQEPERPVVCVYEDIDAIIQKYGEETVLALLDGNLQTDHVINIATTNFPENLNKRIVARPRRFDRVYKILAPSDAVRKGFLKKKLPKTEDLKWWVKETKGMSFAGISEAIISVLCFGHKPEDAVNAMRAMEAAELNSEDFGKTGKRALGFNFDDFGDKDDDDDDDDDIKKMLKSTKAKP